MIIPEKNIYAIHPEANYLGVLAAEIISIVSGDLARLSEAVIILPSRRSGALLKTELLKATNKQSLLMPKIISLGDVDETELELEELGLDIYSETKSLKIIPKHKRLLLLAELVRKAGLFGYDMNRLSMHQSLKLAYSLAELIDDFHKYGKDDVLNLKEILPEELSKHKQYTLDFISFIESEYPKLLAENNYIDPIKKRKDLTERYIKLLRSKNIQSDVIIAGSSGSMPVTRELIKTVLEQKNGHFFLPYTDLDNLIKVENAKDNHQYLIYELLKYLNVNVDDIKLLEDKNGRNTKIISNIFAPEPSHIKEDQFPDIKIIEPENLIEEAKMIGLIIREQLENKKRTALVTNNRKLAKLTKEYLQKWKINIDDSSGVKFSDTDEGNFILQICEFIGSKGKAINLLSLLKNKFSFPELRSSEKENFVFSLEKKMREKNLFKITPDSVDLPEVSELLRIVSKHSDFRAKISDIFKDIHKIINLLSQRNNFFERDTAGEVIEIFNFLMNDGTSNNETEIEYLSEFAKNIFDTVTIRPKFGVTSMTSILSPIEARLLNFDCVIIGGLNYGSWPKRVTSPWLSNNMKNDAGLPESNFFTSLAAHDFVSLLHNKQVFITRSKKEDGEISVESPLLSRIKSYAKNNSLDVTETKYNEYLNEFEESADTTSKIKPYPKPPAAARPNKLSVTNIEKLIYNPYEVYVSKILKLRKLDEIEREGEARDYGTFVHDVLERFTLLHNLDKNKITVENFSKVTDEVFEEYKLNNVATEAWLYNCRSIASDLINIEKERADNTANIFCEKSGSMILPIGDQEFNIICKADRIEISNDNRLVIIDYKTGAASIPSDTDIKRLKKPQLLLELLIAKDGSFGMIDKDTLKNISGEEIAYFLISKSDNGPKVESASDFEMDMVKENLNTLISDLLDPEKPFLISPRSELKPKYREYAHFERVEE